MRNNFIVEKIFAETLQFLLISSMGYPYSVCQINSTNTGNDFLITTITPYSAVTSINNAINPMNLDKKGPDGFVTSKLNLQNVKNAYITNKISAVSILQNVSHATESPFSKDFRDKSGIDKTTDIAIRTLTPTAVDFQTVSTLATKPTITKIDNKSIVTKIQKTDAPMLNYIFDMFSTANKHHHHDQRYGPHFEDIQKEGKPLNITVQAGATVYLNCRISLLQDKTVSWVRRNSMGEEALELLTVGLHTYTGDKRYTMEFQYPNNWRLKIVNAKKEDEGTYECQISTHPPRVTQIHLHVNAPKVVIVDEYNIPLHEKYYEIDSTLQLFCIVRNVVMTSSVVFWRHGDQILNYDTTRGGVSVRTDLMDDGANSSLSIARISKQDSGNYTCSISDSQDYNIIVHILKGESFAELHHGSSTHLCDHCSIVLLIIAIILALSQTTNTFR